ALGRGGRGRTRVVEAPGGRAMRRPEARARGVSGRGGGPTLLGGPASLVWAWRQGLRVDWLAGAAALLPSLLAWWPVRRLLPAPDASGVVRETTPGGPRDFALSTFRAVTVIERQLAAAIASVARAMGAPARDLHSRDAQEYLLFLVGVAVLALLLPLLR